MSHSPVFIPTKGRAGNQPTLRLFPEATLLVEPQEEKAYRQAHPDTDIVVIPDNDRGEGFVRNQCIEVAESRNRDGRLWMLDDDLKRIYDVRHKKLRSPAWVLEEAERWFNLPYDVGMVSLEFGQAWFNHNTVKLNAQCNTAFCVDMAVCGPMKYIEKHFTDIDFVLQLIGRQLSTVRCGYLAYDAPTNASSEGGCYDTYKDVKGLAAATKMMLARWPGLVEPMIIKSDGRIGLRAKTQNWNGWTATPEHAIRHYFGEYR